MKYALAGLLPLILNVMVFAQDKKPAPTGDMFGSMVPMMLIMFVIIYLFMIMPEQKKHKARQAMMNNLKKGDKVVTSGGIYGTVGNVKEATIMVKVADNVVMEFSKGAITTVLNEDGTEKKPEIEKKSGLKKEDAKGQPGLAK